MSSSRTTRWTSPVTNDSLAGSPATGPGVVLYADFSAGSEDATPESFQDIDDLAEQFALSAERRDAIEAGHRLVAERHYAGRVGLAALRLRRGWSQRDLANAIGVLQPHIARLESGRNDPSLGTVRKLAAALGVTIDELARAFEVDESKTR